MHPCTSACLVETVSSNSDETGDRDEPMPCGKAAKADVTPASTDIAESDEDISNENFHERTPIKNLIATDDESDGRETRTTVCLLRLPQWLSRSAVANVHREQDNCATSCCSCNGALLAQESSLRDRGWHSHCRDERLARRLLNTLGGGAQAHDFEEAKAKEIQMCKSILPEVLPLSIFARKHLVGGMIIIQPEHLQEAVNCSQRQQVIICLQIAK